MLILVIIAQEMIRYFKVVKHFCEVVHWHLTSSPVRLSSLSFSSINILSFITLVTVVEKYKVASNNNLFLFEVEFLEKYSIYNSQMYSHQDYPRKSWHHCWLTTISIYFIVLTIPPTTTMPTTQSRSKL
jgi:hypothetical protein